MSFTNDVTTQRGKVRLLIPDRVSGEAMFNDAEIDAFIELGSDNTFRAAALALGVAATDEAKVLSYIKTQNLETDGSKAAKLMLDRVKTLDARADVLDAADGDEDDADGYFDVAEMSVDAFSTRDIYGNALRRSGW